MYSSRCDAILLHHGSSVHRSSSIVLPSSHTQIKLVVDLTAGQITDRIKSAVRIVSAHHQDQWQDTFSSRFVQNRWGGWSFCASRWWPWSALTRSSLWWQCWWRRHSMAAWTHIVLIALQQLLGAAFLAPITYFKERNARPRFTKEIFAYLSMSALLG